MTHPLAVDVVDLQIESFLTAKPGTVVHGQQSTMLGVGSGLEQSADFFAAPDGGQPRAHLGLDDLLIKPCLPQSARVQELQRRPGALERSPGQLPPLIEQV
jgi:hypothetical protein